jgi:molecular chaperone DnaJ
MSEDLYEVLGVPRGADAGQIRKAWLGLARTHHPDKGGDEAKFKKIQRAFDVLSDEGKRQIYDLTGNVPGEDVSGPGGGGGGMGPFGMGGGSGGGGFAFDIGNLFGMFGPHMGGGGPGGSQRRRRPGAPPPKVERIGFTLSQFYNGDTFNINLDRMKFCITCNGDGAKKKETCVLCKGSGINSQVLNMGGITMHTQGPCTGCIGKGFKVAETCDSCNGNGKVSEKKSIEVRVAPGTASGEVFVFQEACSEVPEFEKAPDLQIVIEQVVPQNLSGNMWQRIGNKGQHLETGVTITLAESLVGCTVRLDGHPAYPEGLFIEIPAASFTGDTYCISGFGMPLRGETGMYGDLYVKVTVNVKLTERRILASEAGQQGVKSLFAPLCRTPEGFEEGKTEVQKDLFLSKLGS